MKYNYPTRTGYKVYIKGVRICVFTRNRFEKVLRNNKLGQYTLRVGSYWSKNNKLENPELIIKNYLL